MMPHINMINVVLPLPLAPTTESDFSLGDLDIDIVEGNDAAAVEVATDMFEGNQGERGHSMIHGLSACG